jgi:hypothetical protein
VNDIDSSLLKAFDYAQDRFLARLAGLTDAEYFWEPAAGCWTLRQDETGRWHPDADGGGGPAPDPAPVTTIAWRVAHVGGLALGGFADRLFGPGTRTVAGLEFPGTAAAAREFLTENYQTWRTGLASLNPDQLWRDLGPDWGPYAQDCQADLALHVLDELIHHGAEVGLLRDLYARRTAQGD